MCRFRHAWLERPGVALAIVVWLAVATVFGYGELAERPPYEYMLSARDDRMRSDASDGVWFALLLIDDLKEAPTMRLMIAIVVTLIVATTPGFAGQESGLGDSEKGALVGGIVGLGAGFAASAIYSHTTQQCDSEVYQNTLARCGLPIAGMVIGGAFAGHFIGRLADKPSKDRRSRTGAGQGWRPLTVPAPKVTLRRPTS